MKYNLVSRVNAKIKLRHILPNDIVICEFPKSGMTWLSTIIANTELISKNSDEFVNFYNLHYHIPDIHRVFRLQKCSCQRRFLRTHSMYDKRIQNLIYLVRKPEDVMVSYYNHMHDAGLRTDFLSFVLHSDYGLKRWREHVKGWIFGRTGAQRIHLVRYEELNFQPVPTIKSIYNSLGIDMDDEVIRSAVERSELKNMKISEETYSKFDPAYSSNFFGKSGKIKKDVLMTPQITKLIESDSSDLIAKLYKI